MRLSAILISLSLLLAVAGCGDDDIDTYPISGLTCSDEDPVLDLDPVDCAP